MTDWKGLAARCERATGPDIELSADILEALADDRWRTLEREAAMPCGAPPDVVRQGARDRACYRYPFTASLDIALTLVPEGWSVQFIIHPEEAHCDVYRLGDIVDDGVSLDRPVLQTAEARAATPALALCAAALKARDNG